MHFLLDANLPRSLADRLRSLGHEATDIRDTELAHADDELIAAHARANQYALLSRDGDFGDIRSYPPQDYFGIAVIDLPNTTPVRIVNGVVERFVSQPDFLKRLPGKLAIVELHRVRFRGR